MSRFKSAISEREVTDYRLFCGRRQLIKRLSLGLLAASGWPLAVRGDQSTACSDFMPDKPDAELTAFEDARSYNNYYEFTSDKTLVRHHASALTLEPWTLTIGGEVEQPFTLDLDGIRQRCLEERIYRFRCVEGWSMVVPWQGVQLSRLLTQAKPLSSARFVQFSTLYRPQEMIGQRRPTLEWPYREALRLDEAMHPLTLLATGMYGQTLPPQNGAPLRLVVPWKYGFKSIKAVTRIELLRQQPSTTWQQAVPSEYGFYGNVNPDVSHPRWSQRREVPLGHSKKQATLMFNGYASEVAGLYAGMDLRRLY